MTQKELQALVDKISPDLQIHVCKPMQWGGTTSYTLRHTDPDTGKILSYSLAITGHEVFGPKPIIERAVQAIHQRLKE